MTRCSSEQSDKVMTITTRCGCGTKNSIFFKVQRLKSTDSQKRFFGEVHIYSSSSHLFFRKETNVS